MRPHTESDGNDDTLDPSDLLTEDGTVDQSAVARLATEATRPEPDEDISARECSRLRKRAVGLTALRELVAESDRSRKPVYKHVSGRCRHSDAETDLPALVYDTDADDSHPGRGVWRVPDDGGADSE